MVGGNSRGGNSRSPKTICWTDILVVKTGDDACQLWLTHTKINNEDFQQNLTFCWKTKKNSEDETSEHRGLISMLLRLKIADMTFTRQTHKETNRQAGNGIYKYEHESNY